MPEIDDKWATKVKNLVASFTGDLQKWREADCQTIRGVIAGVSPYSGSARADQGAKIVFNIPSTHIPGFVGNQSGAAYRNRYTKPDSIGERHPSEGAQNDQKKEPDPREQIDRVLGNLIGNARPEDLYYGAVELNGSGMRYYGDVALVLKLQSGDQATLVLDRNSFDLLCPPFREETHRGNIWDPAEAKSKADFISGRWEADLANMAVCKVLTKAMLAERRITVGTISEGVLSDEDYLEVIRNKSFNAREVEEARVAAADAAVDGRVADRLRRGPVPDWAELLWRHRRRKADLALKSAGVGTRVVVSSGRVRG